MPTPPNYTSLKDVTRAEVTKVGIQDVDLLISSQRWPAVPLATSGITVDMISTGDWVAIAWRNDSYPYVTAVLEHTCDLAVNTWEKRQNLTHAQRLARRRRKYAKPKP